MSVDYQLLHTVGQPAINLVTNTDYIHEQGFWYLPWFFMTPAEEANTMPRAYRLDQNYPNPFNPTTTISFALTKPSYVSLTRYDPLGREVRTILDREMEAGEHRIRLDARGLASGLYFYRIVAAEFVMTRKLVILECMRSFHREV